MMPEKKRKNERTPLPMTQKLIIILSALAFGVGIALWNTTPPAKMVALDQASTTNFVFTSLDGRERKMSDFRGKVVFVNSWFTRCPPCVAEMPEFLALAQEHPDDMVFIALSVDPRKPDLLRYLDRLPEETKKTTQADNVYFVHDEGKLISRTMLGVRGFPETIIVGREGQQLFHVKGVIEWLGPKVEEMFARQ